MVCFASYVDNLIFWGKSSYTDCQIIYREWRIIISETKLHYSVSQSLYLAFIQLCWTLTFLPQILKTIFGLVFRLFKLSQYFPISKKLWLLLVSNFTSYILLHKTLCQEPYINIPSFQFNINTTHLLSSFIWEEFSCHLCYTIVSMQLDPVQSI